MQPVDWCIVAVLVLAALGGLNQGFLRSIFAIAGLLLGLILAAWNYSLAASVLLPVVRYERVANALGFVAIALAVMALAGLTGAILSRTAHAMGLGCLDRLGGALLGLLQGALLVTLAVWVAVAFFPGARWLAEGRLPRMFFGVCHITTHVSPDDLAERVRDGLKNLEEASPEWMHPNGKVR
jgi:membrane protein required for colicin V production